MRTHFREENASGAAHRAAHELLVADLERECSAGAKISTALAQRLDAWFAAHEEEFAESTGDPLENATAKPAPATHPISAESTAVGAVPQSVLVPKWCTRHIAKLKVRGSRVRRADEVF